MGSSNAPQAPRTTAPQSGRQSAAKTPWYKRGWVVATAALLLGIALGAASAGAAPEESPEYKSLAADLDEAEAAVASSADELTAAQDELRDVAGDLPAREDAVEKAEAALEKREEELSESEAAVQAASKAVRKREKAVGLVEKQIANNTIPGDGIFEVGVDMKPGLYKTSGTADCYYAVNADANGNNIKSNNIVSGPATVSVSQGEYFETSGCADWVLQP